MATNIIRSFVRRQVRTGSYVDLALHLSKFAQAGLWAVGIAFWIPLFFVLQAWGDPQMGRVIGLLQVSFVVMPALLSLMAVIHVDISARRMQQLRKVSAETPAPALASADRTEPTLRVIGGKG